jgi:membrane-bound lytic murein transglycosylase D
MNDGVPERFSLTPIEAIHHEEDFMRSGISLVCTVLTMVLGIAGAAPAPTYTKMKPAEQVAFLEREAARASAMLSEDGKPAEISADGLLLVKREVDDYASRLESEDSRPWRESIRLVLDRGGRYAPGISKTFQAEGVPPALGIYLAMVESEYNECLESPMGAKGVFQFLPQTGQRFGLAPEDLCDSEKEAVAAARYLKALRGQFGASGRGALVAALAYNQGERKTEETFAGGADFWSTLVRTPNAEGSRYVARILAAAIVGENPAAFGLSGKPLSSY